MAESEEFTRSSRPTRQDIADEAGVSTTVVTWVMSGQAEENRIPVTTIERVREVAERLGYKPNAWAQALRRSKSGILGFVCDDLANPTVGEIVKHIGHAARVREHSLMLFSLGEQEADAGMDIAFSHMGFADGFIVNVFYGDLPSHTRDGLLEGKPFCVIGRNMVKEDLPSVDVDNVRGAELALAHLADIGTSRLGLIIDDNTLRYTQERLMGCERVIAAGSFGEVLRRSRSSGEDPFEAGAAAAEEWIASGTIPDGIFAMGDTMALGALSAFSEQGIDCPGQVRMVGFDEMPFARYASPPLTTVAQPYGRMSEAALEMMLTLLAGKPIAERQKLFAPELRVRRSTG